MIMDADLYGVNIPTSTYGKNVILGGPVCDDIECKKCVVFQPCSDW
jgi:hypothetical protein